MEDRKRKKPTKKQMLEEVIPQKFKEELSNSHRNGLVQGFEICNQMLMEYAKNHTSEEIVAFCRLNVENKKVMEDLVCGKK